ncbi:hypothetical protein EDEG_01624 [Edhazardia aedis USNM 41457]|uniref:Uncharacterized protein n=1 Tax=Edhazardia aedis (strain USNM 41457) TaxID=1003232 RepID=J9DS36_EDHAE|nr:hypothetical protein EDEG_01624 [Edhazardia aedis USNM 41457]|eukprot:EJW04102.1 hypothetical protein EDEG_01624 [Edhazardia aedis USNM 41457]
MLDMNAIISTNVSEQVYNEEPILNNLINQIKEMIDQYLKDLIDDLRLLISKLFAKTLADIINAININQQILSDDISKLYIKYDEKTQNDITDILNNALKLSNSIRQSISRNIDEQNKYVFRRIGEAVPCVVTCY